MQLGHALAQPLHLAHQVIALAEQAGYGVVVFHEEEPMLSRDIVRVGAKSATVHMVDDETAEVWFLTNENRSLRITLPQAGLFALAQRIIDMSDPPTLA